MATITKVINFRVPFDVYESFQNEAKSKKITVTDCILKKLNDSTKVEALNKRIQDLDKANDVLLNICSDFLVEKAKSLPKKKIESLIQWLKTL